MKINRDNYVVFFLDFFEGALPDADRKELMRFLDLHPDLKAEFDDFEMVCLKDDGHVQFPDKASLKKKEVPFDYETMFAAYVEGDLNAEDARTVEELAASDPRYERELSLMKRAKLEPAVEVLPDKRSLKRYPIGAARAAEQTDAGAETTANEGMAARPGESPARRTPLPITAHFTRQRIWYAASAAAAVLLLAMVTFSIFPLREDPQVAIHDGDPSVRRELPVGGEVEQPAAVAEAPAPLQDIRKLPPIESQAVRPGTAGVSGEEQEVRPGTIGVSVEEREVRPGTAGVPGERPAAPQLEALPHRPPPTRPLIAGRMERRESSGLYQHTAALPGALDERKEYQWLAYRDPSEWAVVAHDDDQMPSSGLREVSLAQLAVNQIEERAGIDFREVGDMVASREFSLRELAGRGLSGLNNLMGQPIVVDGETKADGRRVQFAIGDFIEVSRTGPRN